MDDDENPEGNRPLIEAVRREEKQRREARQRKESIDLSGRREGQEREAHGTPIWKLPVSPAKQKRRNRIHPAAVFGFILALVALVMSIPLWGDVIEEDTDNEGNVTKWNQDEDVWMWLTIGFAGGALLSFAGAAFANNR